MKKTSTQIALFLLCTIPFWTSNVIRMMAWIPLLGRNGLVNQTLLSLGIIDEPQDWFLYSDFAVILAFIHLYTMFMMVPIVNSMLRIDTEIIEAARDAGAGIWTIALSVIAPLCRPGIVIGSIFVITIVMGDYITVGVMGGQQIASVGKTIQVQMQYLRVPHRRGQCGGSPGRGLDDHLRHDAAGGREARAMNTRGRRFYILAGIFTLFVLFLYGPMFAIFALSFQGPDGGLTFPMRGLSTHWFEELWKGVGVVDIWAAFYRSLRLGAVVAALTLAISLPAALAYRLGFRGATLSLLHRHRVADRPVDRRFARHRPGVPPVRRLGERVHYRPSDVDRPSSPRRSART